MTGLIHREPKDEVYVNSSLVAKKPCTARFCYVVTRQQQEERMGHGKKLVG